MEMNCSNLFIYILKNEGNFNWINYKMPQKGKTAQKKKVQQCM